MLVQVTCANCHRSFERYQSQTAAYRGLDQDYCSSKCYDEYRMKPVTITCETCNKEFDVWQSRLNRKSKPRFCSTKCKAEAQVGNYAGKKTGKIVKCQMCPTEFYIPPHREKVNARFCSSKCYGTWREKSGISAGENNPRYRDGSTMRTFERLRKAEWRRIANAIREERGNRCENCGKTSSRYKFPVHHKVPWEVSHDDSPENLMVVCRSCHPVLDNLYWSGVETP